MSAVVESQETPITKAVEDKAVESVFWIGGVTGGVIGICAGLISGLSNDAVITVPELGLTAGFSIISFAIGALEATAIARQTIKVVKQNLPKKG